MYNKHSSAKNCNANGFFIAVSAYHLLTGKARSLSVSGCEAVGYVLGGTCLETGLCRLWIEVRNMAQQYKKCTSCGRTLPATLEYFSPEKRTAVGLQAWCKDCFKAYKKRYREEHKTEELAYQKRRRQEAPERERIRLERWRKNNPDKVEAQNARHHENSRDKRNAGARERIKALYKLFPERWRVASEKRRARIAGSGGNFTAKEWEALKKKYGYRCLRCGRTEPEIKLTVDHVIPLSKGGSNSIDNIQPLCWSCNSGKRARHIDYRGGAE